MKRKSSDVELTTPLPSQKTKYSASEKRGSIVKSIDKLALTIASDEAANNNNSFNAAAAMQAFSGQMQMHLEMQQMHANANAEPNGQQQQDDEGNHEATEEAEGKKRGEVHLNLL